MRRLPWLILLIYTLLALVYASAVPPLESSDEAAHYLYVHNLLKDRALPVIASREQITEEQVLVKRWALESHQPPLYYLIGALLISPTQPENIDAYLQPNPLIFIRGITDDNHNKWLHTVTAPTGDAMTALWILRLYSLGLSATTLWLIYRAAKLAFDSELIAVTAMLLVMCLPTYLNIGSSVNNDNLVTLLYTAGVYWSLRVWRYGIGNRDIAIISVILAAIALTKITGLTLFVVVFLALGIGVHQKYFSLRRALITAGCTLIVTAVAAGWWYLRNWSLYGDPIASAATLTLWGREFARPTESGDILSEIMRVWRSFWAMVGHLHNPVYAPDWGYVYVTVITILGIVGWGIALMRQTLAQRLTHLLLAVAVVLPVFTLAIGTRSIDISYGRLLFPALVGFATLLATGWTTLLRRFAPLVILPLVGWMLVVRFVTLPEAYPMLAPVPDIVLNFPEDAIPVEVYSGDLGIFAYKLQTETVQPGDTLHFDLYVVLGSPYSRLLSGEVPENPALFVTILDPITGEALGKTAVYPGIAPTDSYQRDLVYRAPLSVQVDVPEALSPRRLQVQVGWQTALDTNYLPLKKDGKILDALILGAATLIDPRYTPPAVDHPSDAVFGDAIALDGYTLSGASLKPGETLGLTLKWRGLQPLFEDWVLTAQLLDSNGVLVTQDDGDLPGYPTSAWRKDAVVIDERALTLPADAQPGMYNVVLGWYRLSDLVRLPTAQGQNDLYLLPEIIQVNSDS